MDGCSLVSEHDEVSPPGQWQQFEDSLTIYILQRWAGVQLLKVMFSFLLSKYISVTRDP